jgi:type IV pilus assembly protein PilF
MKWLVVVVCISLMAAACSSETVLPHDRRERASHLNAQLGAAYMKQGRYDVALDKLQKALEFDKNNGKAHHYLAELYRRLGKEDKAKEHYERAFELIPNDSALLNNYGVYLCYNGKYDEADQYFNKVLNDPLYAHKAQVHENMGICAQRKGNLQEAEGQFRKALGLNAKLPTSLLQMAKLTFDQGQTKNANNYYQHYLQLAPQTPESLWLGILLEMENGDKNKVASYSVLLRNKYPNSKEAGLLKKLENRE